MASAIIHLCVAKEVNKYLKMDEKTLFIGSIAPDVSKQIGMQKEISHFLNPQLGEDVPDIDYFLSKYRSDLNKPFEMGYFIHLLTDKYWFRDYITKFVERFSSNPYKKMLIEKAMTEIIYQDYTSLNTELIDEYELSLDIFENRFEIPKTCIKEVEADYLEILIDKMGIILENTNEEKAILFDCTDVKNFIEETVKYIIKDIQLLDIKFD